MECGVQSLQCQGEQRAVDLREELPAHQQTDEAEGPYALANLFQVPASLFGEEQAQSAVAIERGNWNQVERSQQHVEREQQAEKSGRSFSEARCTRLDNALKIGGFGRVE